MLKWLENNFESIYLGNQEGDGAPDKGESKRVSSVVRLRYIRTVLEGTDAEASSKIDDDTLRKEVDRLKKAMKDKKKKMSIKIDDKDKSSSSYRDS